MQSHYISCSILHLHVDPLLMHEYRICNGHGSKDVWIIKQIERENLNPHT